MLGAIAGDIIGSPYERYPIKKVEFPLFQESSRFTDDTVLTIAVASAILDGDDYAVRLQSYGQKYPRAGYGPAFYKWIFTPNPQAYNSWGNGAAMRVSPIGFAFETIERVMEEARKSAQVSHDHPEGIKGAQATALAVHLAWKGWSKSKIREEITARFGFNLDRSLAEIRPGYRFDVSCQGSVPEALIAFLESGDYEDAVRNAVSLGGDSDTLACIAGGIAHAYYREIPGAIVQSTLERLPQEFIHVIERFETVFINQS